MYFSCMDQKTVDQKAAEPLKAELDRIAALSSKKDLAELVAHLTRIGTALCCELVRSLTRRIQIK